MLSPTRELAVQTEKVALALGNFMNVQVHACIGGRSIGEDIRKLDYGQHIVSGTPGRVFDMIKRRNLRTRGIKILVLVRALQPAHTHQGFRTNSIGATGFFFRVCFFPPPSGEAPAIQPCLFPKDFHS